MMATTGLAPIDHRQRVLRALGITAYRLRDQAEPASAASVATPAVLPAPATAGNAHCVLVLPTGLDARQQALLDGIMRALGEAFAHAAKVDVVAGELSEPAPAAQAYLAFGEAQTRALGRSLTAEVMAHAEVVLLDTPDALLQAAGKRRLWQAIGGLRRHWRATARAQD